MINKINTFLFLIYLLAFSPFLLNITGLDENEALFSVILLLVDLGLLLIGTSSLVKKTFNLKILIIVIVILFFTYVSHDYSLISHINGIREMIDIFLVFSFYEEVAGSPYKKLLDKKIQKFMKIFLAAQIPISLYQFILYGAGDSVGGSLGRGNSGILTFVVILMVYYTIKNGYSRLGWKVYLNTIFLVPLFVNETKISFILIPLMFLLLGKTKKLSTIFVSLMGAVAFFFLLNILYSDQGRKVQNPFERIFNEDYLDQYLLGAENSGKKNIQIDVPRFTKVILAIQLTGKNASEALFGIQCGAFKGGKVVEKSTFSKNYFWLLLGSRPYLFYLLITGGWCLVLTMLIFFHRKIFRGFELSADKRLAYLCGIFLFIIFLYNDSPRSQFFIIMFAYFLIYSKGYSKRLMATKLNVAGSSPNLEPDHQR